MELTEATIDNLSDAFRNALVRGHEMNAGQVKIGYVVKNGSSLSFTINFPEGE